MKANSKSVLFATYKNGTKNEQWPVAVFNKDDDARPFAVAVMTAYKTGDVERLKALGFDRLAADDGKVHPGLRFSRVTVPYAPEAIAADDDPFAGDNSATS